jgi:DNA polymerase-3 subunit delta'
MKSWRWYHSAYYQTAWQWMTEHSPSDQSFAALLGIAGHDDFLHMLNAAVMAGRMPHAWLLTGPRGIGKASMARKAAAWLLSESRGQGHWLNDPARPVDIDPNDIAAGQVLNGAHPDYMLIKPDEDDNKSGQIKVDQIRRMLPFMMHKPARGGWRVAIIDSMDDVNRNGANAMLKLLEEPPEQAVIFLIASQVGRLPPTIRSRCRVARMAPLSGSDCHTALTQIWPDADQAHITMLAHLSQGAPGQAVKLAETGSADMYQVVCALLAAPRLDAAALATICGKWGRGTAAGRDGRDGAVFCLGRLLRLAALQASGIIPNPLCDFEKTVIGVLVKRHSATHLAALHDGFTRDAARAEGLYLDFARFLERHLTKLYEKTLP